MRLLQISALFALVPRAIAGWADISCGGGACVARKTDGTAEAWGSSLYGGDASGVTLTNVADISCGGYA